MAKKYPQGDSNINLQSHSSKGLSENSKSQAVHNPVHILEKHPELARIIMAWPNLPEDTKAKIISLIEKDK